MRTLNVILSVAASLALGMPAARADSPPPQNPSDGANPKQEPAPKDKPTPEDYEFDLNQTSATLKVGETGVVSLVIRAKNGLKIHPQAPLEVKLREGPGLKVGKAKLGRGDAVDAKAANPELRTELVGVAAGTHAVEADISFFLCSDTWCQRVSDRTRTTISVE